MLHKMLFTRSVAYTASIKPRIVQAIPSAGPFTTPMIGLGKSIREFTKILKKKCIYWIIHKTNWTEKFTYFKLRFPCSAASETEPVKEVKLLKSFPLEKIFPAPVTATRVVFGSSAASFKSYKTF